MRNIEGLLAKQSLVEEYLSAGAHWLSTYHFSSIFLWQDFFDFEFELHQDQLCIYAHQPGASFMYLPPLGPKTSSSTIEHCFAKMNKVNHRTARIENVEQLALPQFSQTYKAQVKAHEYVYRKQDLIDLKGHAYKSQRHDIHHFEQHHASVFRRYEEKDARGCLSLYEQWAKNRHEKHDDPIYRQMLEENRIVHELAMFFYRQLGLTGYVVEIDKKIAAYSFGYSLNSEIFCVLLEITNVSSTGLSAFIFNRVCADEQQRQYTFINTMDDFGIPYVAASKQAYHPTVKPVSYTITVN